MGRKIYKKEKKMKTKKCVKCNKVYRLDFFRTKQKNYKVKHNDTCKNCEDDWLKIIQKRLCNAEKPDCTPPSVSRILTGFRWLCSCAVAHACTYAHARLKPPFLQVCAVVRMCISIENYRKVCINIHLYLGEIGFSKRNIVRI